MPMRAQRLTFRALDLVIIDLVNGRSDAAAAAPNA
jgi:hypothetical protein